MTACSGAPWTPDPVTRERRELLHAWNKAVAARTAAVNSLKCALHFYSLLSSSAGNFAAHEQKT
jgi:hypothetical protein